MNVSRPMSDSPCCSLCGGPSITRHGSQEEDPEPHWTNLTYLLSGSLGDRSSDVLTLCGFLVGDRLTTRAHSTPDFIDGFVTEFTDYDVSTHRANPRTFILHEFCWQFLLTRTCIKSGIQPDGKHLGKWLFHILHSTPWTEAGILIPLHRYCGIFSIRQNDPRPELLMADPTQHHLIALLEANRPNPAASNYLSQGRSMIDTKLNQSDPFNKMPIEIVIQVYTHLSLKDISNACLSSRYLATRCYVNGLPASFWASRFSIDMEMGFLLIDKLPSNDMNWRHVYQTCESYLKEPAFGNRLRIWKCLEDVSTILSGLVTLAGGEEPRLGNEKSELSIPVPFSLGQQVRCPCLPDRFESRIPIESIKLGVRPREHHLFMLDGPLSLEISVMSLVSGTYISGIRTIGADGRNEPQLVEKAGLISPPSVQSFPIPAGTKISAVDVCISSSGIHGVEFCLLRPDGTTYTHTVGEFSCPSSLFGVTRLAAHGGIAGLVFGFDIYKAISVQILEHQTMQRPEHLPRLWNPKLPTNSEMAQVSHLLYRQPDTASYLDINMYIPFGGEDGSRLPFLCRLTVLSHGKTGFHGLLFAYSDGKELLFGQRQVLPYTDDSILCVEESFTIDGLNGERIIHFHATNMGYEIQGQDRIRTISVWTNIGRQYAFGSFAHDKPLDSVELLSGDGQVTAFVAQVSSISQTFVALKAHKIPLKRPGQQLKTLIAPRLLDANEFPEPLSPPGKNRLMLQAPCFTTASLRCIRRIHMSKGEKGRCRHEDNISGLLIKYYGDKPSVVVGQWMTESTSFSLEQGERLTEVSFSVETTEERFLSREFFEPVTAVRFTTSLGKQFELRSGLKTAEEETLLRYHSTPYEDMDYITWAFTSMMDEVLVSFKAAPTLGDGRLVLANSRHQHQPRDMALGETRILFNYQASRTTGHWYVSYDRPEIRRHRGLLFFRKFDRFGTQMRVSTILRTADSNGALIGLEFHYPDGSIDRQGSTEGHTDIFWRRDDSRNESLRRLAVYSCRSGSKGIMLYTSLGRWISFGTRSDSPDCVASYAIDLDTMDKEIIPPGVSPDCLVSHGFPGTENKKAICGGVGIWVVSEYRRGSSGLEMADLGPVYLAGPGLNNQV